MLEVKNLTVHYNGAMALNNVSITVKQGEFVTVVGPNGAGKTTLLRAISGTIREFQRGRREHAHLTGEILFENERIDKLKAWNIVERGIIHCPERRRLFPEMTVYENLIMGSYLRKDKENIRNDLERVYQLFPILKERKDQMAQTLSGGEGQMLAIARALMSKPKLLMIDEPSLGLAPLIKQKVFDSIKEIWSLGITVLLVEQDVSIALSLANRGYVLAHGRIAAQGTREELLKNKDLREMYIGI
ncbi:MAG: ABC transporter ATP-binding protein [Candidatus Bathyarchaeia archaeon]|nr:ABC transporter ATP-binding protein [Candidatus Bathyarchaeia archaeon]